MGKFFFERVINYKGYLVELQGHLFNFLSICHQCLLSFEIIRSLKMF